MSDISERFEKALLSLDRLAVRRLVTESAGRLTAMELVDGVIVAALRSIGERWERGDTSLSQVYMSGRICEELVDRLLPPGDPQRKDQPPMAIAVLEDYHLLGKRIVYSVLRAGGFEIKDYGRVTVDEVVSKVKSDQIRVLLISTLMLHSALRIREVAAKLKAELLDVKIVVGGAPFIFDTQLWRDVHADAMGASASDVTEIIQVLMGSLS
jgi:methanogenic corrinoid protein MtbC1